MLYGIKVVWILGQIVPGPVWFNPQVVYFFVPYQLGPILGLLGTLIPLGPGLAALGSGDIVTLAEALTVAFDTTVTGLVMGALAYLVSKFKKQWYESDLIVLETIAEAELETLNRKWVLCLGKNVELVNL